MRLLESRPGRSRCIRDAQGRPSIARSHAWSARGRLDRLGAGRAVTYRIPESMPTVSTARAVAEREAVASLPWTPASRALAAALSAPIGTRTPVAYQRRFVDRYVPNRSALLPVELAAQLLDAGRSREQQPAGTYARKVLEQLLIDLSWSSSRLEGNRKTLLDTRRLFEQGRSEADDRDATMLLNHKDAIEFIVDAVPVEGITVPVVRNVQSLLMRDLLPHPSDLGAIRRTIVSIQDSVYVPTQVPKLIEEMLALVVDKARRIRHPIEASFFLWIHIAYLQPFVDGNKRTSRLAANLPLMLSNCAPLSFLDVTQADDSFAMLGVYERLDPSLAVKLFAWTYRRSIDRYRAVLESMGAPDPLRARYREQLGEAVRRIVFHRETMARTLKAAAVAAQDRAAFRAMLAVELAHLEPYNCARYRLPIGSTQAWIAKGRPR